jgi:hypothetical protein
LRLIAPAEHRADAVVEVKDQPSDNPCQIKCAARRLAPVSIGCVWLTHFAQSCVGTTGVFGKKKIASMQSR